MDEFLRIIGFDFQLIHDAVLTGINVLILFFALSYLLFNPARAFLEKRRQKIAGELAEAAEDKKTAEELKAEYESKLKEVNKEAMVKEADILEEARTEAARIIERANRQIELDRKKALDEMKQEMVSIASLMAGKVVAASIDTKIQESLIDETLKEMGESTWLS